MHVTLLAAMTADGFIARHATDRSFDWTSPEDKKFYVSQIKEAGAVVMGSRTFATFTRYPKGLEFVIYTRSPSKFSNPKPNVITAWATDEQPHNVLKTLADHGHERVAICGGASIYSLFMQANLVDRLLLTVEARVFGQGVGLFSQAHETALSLKQVLQLSSDTVVLEYAVG